VVLERCEGSFLVRADLSENFILGLEERGRLQLDNQVTSLLESINESVVVVNASVEGSGGLVVDIVSIAKIVGETNKSVLLTGQLLLIQSLLSFDDWDLLLGFKESIFFILDLTFIAFDS
jgi:hypothetical protein